MKDKNTLVNDALIQLRSIISDAYRKQILESLYDKGFKAGKESIKSENLKNSKDE